MILFFDPKTGHITKETESLGEVSVTLDEARAAWMNCEVTNGNMAFHRLATHFDFDVQKCLEWYRQAR